eukprot:scaffold884_cov398-Prasinococcus_capsulatus_cf.AAC.3
MYHGRMRSSVATVDRTSKGTSALAVSIRTTGAPQAGYEHAVGGWCPLTCGPQRGARNKVHVRNVRHGGRETKDRLHVDEGQRYPPGTGGTRVNPNQAPCHLGGWCSPHGDGHWTGTIWPQKCPLSFRASGAEIGPVLGLPVLTFQTSGRFLPSASANEYWRRRNCCCGPVEAVTVAATTPLHHW